MNASQLDDYRRRWPDEGAVVGHFEELLAEGSPAFVRERLAGHFTASAWLVAGDGGRILLTHHRKLGLWLQPGGHCDGDANLAAVALRGTLVDPDFYLAALDENLQKKMAL